MELEICFTMKDKEVFICEGRATYYFDDWMPDKLEVCIKKLKAKFNNKIKITSVHAWARTPEEIKNCCDIVFNAPKEA